MNHPYGQPVKHYPLNKILPVGHVTQSFEFGPVQVKHVVSQVIQSLPIL